MSNFIKRFESEKLADKDIFLEGQDLNYKKIFENKKLVDTAGFVPLDVRIKQFLISGEQAKFSAEMFDSDDWRYMFNNINENALELSDDVEDVHRKLAVVIERQNELLIKKGLIKPAEAGAPTEIANSESETKAKSGEGSAAASNAD